MLYSLDVTSRTIAVSWIITGGTFKNHKHSAKTLNPLLSAPPCTLQICPAGSGIVSGFPRTTLCMLPHSWDVFSAFLLDFAPPESITSPATAIQVCPELFANHSATWMLFIHTRLRKITCMKTTLKKTKLILKMHKAGAGACGLASNKIQIKQSGRKWEICPISLTFKQQI